MNYSDKRIVVAGGGFGGVYTCLYLQKYFNGVKNPPRITLISKEDYFLFTPLLHEVVSGSIHFSNIAQPLEKIINHRVCDFFVANIKQINLERGAVVTSRGDVLYDYLVLATGAETRNYNFNRKAIFGLKNLKDAIQLKNRIIEMFENASETLKEDIRKKMLSFVVIGGGPTGVELIAELHEFIYGALLSKYPRARKEDISLCLVHAQEELLNGLDPFIRCKAEQALKKKKEIKILFHTKVKSITFDGVCLENGELIVTNTPILAAGITPVIINFFPQVSLDFDGQIPVNSFFQLAQHPNVLAIGDMAKIIDARSGEKAPQTAQAAVEEARVVASNIIAMLKKRPLTCFTYKERGQIVSLGRWNAAAKIFGFKFSGHLAWWVWRTIYVSKIIGWKNKVRVVADWTIRMFYPRDISKL